MFFKGEFIGGYDILVDMHQTGELKKELESIGIKPKLEDKTEWILLNFNLIYDYNSLLSIYVTFN